MNILNIKTGDVCRFLQVTKVTLYNHQKEGKISGHKLPNGYWNWDDKSVYSYFNKDVPRVIHARVSTNKQKPDLENQIHLLKEWCFSKGIILNGLFSDDASGISFEKRKNFFRMLEGIPQERRYSALDDESIGKHATYMDKRIKQGLFQSSRGIKINADVNAKMNILRKVVPTAFTGKGIAAMVLSPGIVKIR